MAVVYFDASASVKLVLEEEASDLAVEVWDACDAAVAARLAYPEVRAALAAAHRAGLLTESGHRRAVELWEQIWSATRPVELTSAVARAAGDLATRHGLRGADAVHLASALALDEPALILATWDRRLATAAAREGLGTVPAVSV